jgi:hypothetical protein
MGMGSLRGDNGGGGRAPDGGGLPDLPPEWGTVIIPDDPAELAKESSAVRRELRRFARRNWWRHRLRLPLLTEAGSRETPTLGLPILIMAIALVATVTSLFALAWPTSSPRPVASPAQHPGAASTVADLMFTDADGGAVHLRNVLPAVLLLLSDGCDCQSLEVAVAQAAPAGVTVLAVGHDAPALPNPRPSGLRLRSLADPAGKLRTTYGGFPPTSATVAVLVRSTGDVVRTIRPVTAVTDFKDALSQLN